MRAFVQHTIGMVAAGVLASSLVLAAWMLSPKPTPAPEPSDGSSHETLQKAQLIGRWSFVNAKNQQAFVEFTEFGSWFGSDGCNGTSGWWGERDGTLQMQPTGAMTQIGCDNAPIPSGEITGSTSPGGELELHILGNDGDERGTVALQRRGEGLFALAGSSWGLEDNTDPAIDARPRIRFSTDGKWSGTDGCNTLGGTWSWKLEADGNDIDSLRAVLQIGPGYATTLKACEHTSRFPAELKQPHRLTVLSEEALLLDPTAEGSQRGFFLRRVEPATKG